MNIITHKKYLLEMDIWEALQKPAEAEVDQIILAIRQNMTHCGNVKLTIVSEA